MLLQQITILVACGFPGATGEKSLLANEEMHIRSLSWEDPQLVYIWSKHFLCGVGNGNPPQYSCLENPMDRGAQQSTEHTY